ncbi:hypothetical protein [Roseibaca sp. Y0-43]|uniref:hypothetical protein n=1 Tax=Roseibaca sp. Y0-43 TaxID=2816854 RepID=UPI001D0C0F91|nr:hypothetical protein [Roseibaca sp. Y0-43]MCC1482850.1 hypothetical protein [Roseibaca sp. Y0-43]
MKNVLVHLPLPHFNSDQLVRSLISNKVVYEKIGLSTPDPIIYREKFTRLYDGWRISNNKCESISEIRNIFENISTDIFISLPKIPSRPEHIVDACGLLPNLEISIDMLKNIFNKHRINILIGIVNPSSLIGALVQTKVISDDAPTSTFATSQNYWYDSIGGCADENPDISFIAWRHEDAHIIWPTILRLVGSVPNKIPAPGCLDMLANYIDRNRVKSLEVAIKSSWPQSDAFIQKMIKECISFDTGCNSVGRKIKVNGWTSQIFDKFEEVYAEDCRLLAGDDSIAFIQPETEIKCQHAQIHRSTLKYS